MSKRVPEAHALPTNGFSSRSGTVRTPEVDAARARDAYGASLRLSIRAKGLIDGRLALRASWSGMEDYPRALIELEEHFATDEACRDYLIRLRWPEGFLCPGCGHGRTWSVRRVWFECAR